jgi:DNA repair/transcription protein MET18/MMS19
MAALLEIHQGDGHFLPKFISYFDGEKDPRNLMVIFGILNVIMTEWDASSCVQVSSS